MSLFPKIQRPCPYIDRIESAMDGDFCRMCQRQVHDLSAMDDRERAAFLASCTGKTCVSYTVRIKPALAAAALAGSAVAMLTLGLESSMNDASQVLPHHDYRSDILLGEIISPGPLQIETEPSMPTKPERRPSAHPAPANRG